MITARQAYVLGVEAAVDRFGLDCDPYQGDIPALSHAWRNGWSDWNNGRCDERGNPYPKEDRE